MLSTKLTYQKERKIASNYYIFLKKLFQYKNLLQRVDLIYQLPKCHVRNLELKGVSSMFSLFEAIFLMFVSFSGNFNCLIINSTLKNCQQSLKLCTLKFLQPDFLALSSEILLSLQELWELLLSLFFCLKLYFTLNSQKINLEQLFAPFIKFARTDIQLD